MLKTVIYFDDLTRFLASVFIKEIIIIQIRFH